MKTHRKAPKYFMGFWGVIILIPLNVNVYSQAGIQKSYSSSKSESQNIKVDDSKRVEWFAGNDIIRQDFENCIPRNLIIRDSILKGFWNLRTKGWAGDSGKIVLNPSSTAPNLLYAPALSGYYSLYVGTRAVDALSDFGIVLMPMKDTVIIKSPVGTSKLNWDIELPVKKLIKMDGVKILVLNLGNSSYIRNFKFVPMYPKENGGNIIKHITILKEDGRHFAFPGICRDKNGDIIIVAREAKSHVSKGDYGKIVLCRSRDNGITWSNKKNILENEGIDYRDPAINSLDDGTLLLTYHPVGNGASPSTIRSTDHGASWEKPVSSLGVFSPNGVVENKSVIYYCGNLVVNDVNYVDIVQSTDKGRSWKEYSTIITSPAYSEMMSSVFYNEPFFTILGNGKWLAMFRVDMDGYLRQSTSDGNGISKTWTFPKKNGIWGLPPHILLTNQGLLICSYGYRKKPYGIRACVSKDSGSNWDLKHEIILRDDGGSDDLGYAKTIQLTIDTFFTVYYFHNASQHGTEIDGTKWKLLDK